MVALSHSPSVVLPLVGKMVLHLILGKTFPDYTQAHSLEGEH